MNTRRIRARRNTRDSSILVRIGLKGPDLGGSGSGPSGWQYWCAWIWAMFRGIPGTSLGLGFPELVDRLDPRWPPNDAFLYYERS